MFFCDFDRGCLERKIDVLFPQWAADDERIMILSPHDDDALIGAGYALYAALRNKAEVFVLIFSNGTLGYSRLKEKAAISRLRRRETVNAYQQLGLTPDMLIWFDYNDSCVFSQLAREQHEHQTDCFRRMIVLLRQNRITRVMVPNGYYEHLDHLAVWIFGTYYAPLAGDAFCPDWGRPYPCRSFLQYSVWADFSPENALVRRRNVALLANRAIIVESAIEKQICQGICAYRSQERIIRGLITARRKRLVGGNYAELYCAYEPRPKLNFKPYLAEIQMLQRKERRRKCH